MTYPTTDCVWFDASILPDTKLYGPYPRVVVATQWVRNPEFGYGQRVAELRFLGGNPSRPWWVEPGTLKPIESEVLVVRYWTSMLKDPGEQFETDNRRL